VLLLNSIPMFVYRTLLCAAALATAALTAALAQSASPPEPVAAPAAASPLPKPSPLPEPSGSPNAGSVAPAPATLTIPLSIGVPGGPPAQSYTAFMRAAQVQPGVIDLVRKDDELYFDLNAQSFGRTFIIAPSLASGVGSGAFAGRVYEPFLITFKRVGKRVLWISPNTRYVAHAGSSAANSLAVSVADAVLFSSPIVAEDTAKNHVIISPSIFLTDFEGIGADLGRSGGTPASAGLLLLVSRPTYAVDPSKSYYAQSKGFPQNDEISVNLTFSGPPNALPTVPDGRGIPIVVHYSIVTPPDPDPAFLPRYADDRVGYFITARKRYDDDSLATPFERFIERWNLDHGQITFYLTNEIPPQYRATVRRGLLAWNDAFARIGRPHVIEVKDQPADPNWDPDDARYSTVRWITSDRTEFSAYSPTVADPRSGQIVRAEVVIDGESLRAIKRGYVDTIVPLHRLDTAFAAPPPGGAAAASASALDPVDVGPASDDVCQYAQGSLSQAALGTMLLAAHGHGSAADRERYATNWLYATVMHEAGHTLGLRHNFEGSTAYTQAELHDPAFTRTHGTTASVMDYTPVNLAAPGKRQADYFPTRLGPYDYWAIAYGYTQFANVHSSTEELPYLRAIADRSTQRGLAYGTDEDAAEPIAIDPQIARFDLSNDPLTYDRDMLELNESVAKTLTRRYPGDTRSYQEIRASLVTVLNNELSSIDLAARYIGGIYTSRAHRGQAGAGPPFRSIGRAEQHRAFGLIDRYVFSSHAFNYSPQLLNELTATRFGFHWDSGDLRRPDFPLREVVAEIQDDAISTMFSAPNLARIADQSLKVARPGETMTLADLFAWTNAAVYDDFGSPVIAPTHRELQRRFADLQMEIALLPSFVLDTLGLPRETQALARQALVAIARRLPAAVGAARDPGTQAHLADLQSRIAGALIPQTTRPL
jgi:hypothetical protein